MNMKWNWGTKLLIAMILFMGMIVVLVYFSMRQTYYLVEKDYYPKALEYQEKIDKQNNARDLGEKILVEQRGRQVVFTFQPSFDPAQIRGTIKFYRPSDDRMDRDFAILADSSGLQVCSLEDVMQGRYIIQIDYEVDGKGYYQEESFTINIR